MFTSQVKRRWSPGLRLELLPVDFQNQIWVLLHSVMFWKLLCPQGSAQWSAYMQCIFTWKARSSLGQLGCWAITAFEFSNLLAAVVGILASAAASSRFLSCQITAQALEKSQSPCRVLHDLLLAGSLKLALQQLCKTPWGINTISCIKKKKKKKTIMREGDWSKNCH